MAHEGGLPLPLQLALIRPAHVGLDNEACPNILPKASCDVERHWLFPRAPIMEERVQERLDESIENSNYNPIE